MRTMSRMGLSKPSSPAVRRRLTVGVMGATLSTLVGILLGSDVFSSALIGCVLGFTAAISIPRGSTDDDAGE